jgi:hypothetical protein
MYFRSIIALVLAIATAPVYAQGEAPPASPAQYSGFLGDYSKLQPAADREGVMLYLDPAAKGRRYTKVMFRPVEVYVAPNAEYKGVQPEVLKRMTDQFQAAFKRALEPAYQIVSEPGPDVMQVRSAITGFQTVAPPMNPTDLLPIKAVFNIGRAAAGKAPQRAELTAEIEVLDADNRRLAAAVATRRGDRSLSQGEQITWQHLEAISEYWAKSFRQRLDELRGAAAQ